MPTGEVTDAGGNRTGDPMTCTATDIHITMATWKGGCSRAGASRRQKRPRVVRHTAAWVGRRAGGRTAVIQAGGDWVVSGRGGTQRISLWYGEWREEGEEEEEEEEGEGEGKDPNLIQLPSARRANR
ncbi:unnamed protein product [Arctogadus glacialis]